MSKEKPLLNWILIAKGIGIVLVVIGHFYPDNAPAYWHIVRDVIYTFHMPLFFLLSGFLYSHGKHRYPDLIKGKVKRLLYPFISIAILFFFIKYLAGIFFQLEHSVGMDSIIALLLTPSSSYMPLLWFVHALFLMFLIYPLMRSIITNNWVLLVLLVLINILLGSDYVVLGKVVANMPFFIMGVILRESSALKKLAITGRATQVMALLVAFSLAYLLISRVNSDSRLMYLFELFLGLAGTLVIINVSYFIDNSSKKTIRTVLTEVGYYSMTIYLFHTLFESAIRIGLQQGLGRFNLSIGFELVAILAVIAGVIFPLILEKKILRKQAITRKYILGAG